MPDESGKMRIMCPNLSCGKVLSVPQAARGKTVRCRHCGFSIRIPAPQASQPAPPPAAGTDEPPLRESA